jgi:hypothetical protein
MFTTKSCKARPESARRRYLQYRNPAEAGFLIISFHDRQNDTVALLWGHQLNPIVHHTDATAELGVPFAETLGFDYLCA